MTKHTPGPWETDCEVETFDGTDLPSTVYINYGSGKGGEICTMHHEPEEGRGRDWEEGKCNAHLIAAAPELLAACEAFVTARTNPELTKAVNLAEQAIAKAKGTP